MKRLIVSADDFGMSAGVNQGIARAYRDGVLTDAALMVTGSAFEDAVALARAHPGLSVGLHLVLAQGRAAAPPGEIPLLVDGDGLFGNNAIRAGGRYFFLPRVREQLRREITAQLDRFASTGLPLSHVDGHMTVHVHPTVLGILLELAGRYGIRAVRLPRDPLRAALRFDPRHAGRKMFEAGVFALLCRRALRPLARAGIGHPDRIFGLHQTGHVGEEYWQYVLERLPAGVSEIYCHPAMPDTEARRARPADYDPRGELAALISPAVRVALDRTGATLTSYRELSGGFSSSRQASNAR